MHPPQEGLRWWQNGLSCIERKTTTRGSLFAREAFVRSTNGPRSNFIRDDVSNSTSSGSMRVYTVVGAELTSFGKIHRDAHDDRLGP